LEPHRLNPAAPTILIVDDHSDLRDAISILLHHEGFRTADAGYGAEALDCLRVNPTIAAIILDLDMPVMKGWEFLAACRQHPMGGANPDAGVDRPVPTIGGGKNSTTRGYSRSHSISITYSPWCGA
jgi:CheY-like chemotaxis protein